MTFNPAFGCYWIPLYFSMMFYFRFHAPYHVDRKRTKLTGKNFNRKRSTWYGKTHGTEQKQTKHYWSYISLGSCSLQDFSKLSNNLMQLWFLDIFLRSRFSCTHKPANLSLVHIKSNVLILFEDSNFLTGREKNTDPADMAIWFGQ